MPGEDVQWRLLVDRQAKVAECPVWSAEQNALFWIDVYGPALYRTAFDTGETAHWPLPDTIGSFALFAAEERAILALRNRLAVLDLRTGEIDPLCNVPMDEENYRLNDGRCDPAGRFWAGTMRRPKSTVADGGAHFFRFDKRGLSCEIGDITIANGLAWNGDGSTMYLADRPNWRILAFDYDVVSGTVGNRRVFARLPQGDIPDGASVDHSGGYWIALYGAGRIVRFGQDGRVDRIVNAPTSYPTMVGFGGPHMMFVTTARSGPAGPKGEPHSGGVFVADLGVSGPAAYQYDL
jgi:sugar lactone lactonase YvrE